MSIQHSAGIILYRQVSPGHHKSAWGVWLVHPGGVMNKKAPFGLPKGHVESGEDIWQTAVRELKEETGVDLLQEDRTKFIFLGKHQQSSHKIISIFGYLYEGEIINPPPSNTCQIEFPKGVFTVIPEIDQIRFFVIEDAKKNILPSQLPVLIELEKYLKKT